MRFETRYDRWLVALTDLAAVVTCVVERLRMGNSARSTDDRLSAPGGGRAVLRRLTSYVKTS
jgi:hypothetical protein